MRYRPLGLCGSTAVIVVIVVFTARDSGTMSSPAIAQYRWRRGVCQHDHTRGSHACVQPYM